LKTGVKTSNDFAVALQEWLNTEAPRGVDSADEAAAYVIQLAAIVANVVVYRNEDPDMAYVALCTVLRRKLDRAIVIARETRT
jgi:hypothetical protein